MCPRQSVSGGQRPKRSLSSSPDAGKFPNLRFGVFSWRSLIKDDSSLPLLPSAFGRRAVRNGSDPPTRAGFHYTIRTKGFQFFSVLPPVFSTDSARFPDSKKAAFSGCFFFFGKELLFFSPSFQESSLCYFGSLSARSSVFPRSNRKGTPEKECLLLHHSGFFRSIPPQRSRCWPGARSCRRPCGRARPA